MKEKFKINKGITLVALVIIIIILLILAGISIATLTGSGLFEKARLAEQKTKESQQKEENILYYYSDQIELFQNTRSNESTKSKYINSVSFETEEIGAKYIKLNVSVDIRDNTKILGYHCFAIKSSDANFIKAEMSKANSIRIEGLEKNTKYKVFVVAYDIYNNYTSSAEVEISTIDGIYLKDVLQTPSTYFMLKNGDVFIGTNTPMLLLKEAFYGDTGTWTEVNSAAISYNPSLSSSLMTKEQAQLMGDGIDYKHTTSECRWYLKTEYSSDIHYRVYQSSIGYNTNGGDSYKCNCRPVVTMPDDAMYISGTGTELDPYIISNY